MTIMKMMKFSLGVIMILLLMWIGRHYFDYDTGKLREWILSFGLFAPLIYLVFCAIRPLIFFPFLILSVAGGLAFGAIFGTILTVMGGVIGGLLSFWLARRYGKLLLFKQWRTRTQKLQANIDQKGFYYVLLLRLIPLLNFDLVSYASGVSNVKARPYLFGTLIGMIPGTVALTLFGSTLATGQSKLIAFAIMLILCMLILSLMIRYKIKNRINIE